MEAALLLLLLIARQDSAVYPRETHPIAPPLSHPQLMPAAEPTILISVVRFVGGKYWISFYNSNDNNMTINLGPLDGSSALWASALFAKNSCI